MSTQPQSEQPDLSEPLNSDNVGSRSQRNSMELDLDRCVNKNPFLPNERFIYEFRPEWESFFEKMDNKLISIVQYIHHRDIQRQTTARRCVGAIFLGLSFTLTFITRIENISCLSILLLALGYDHIGRWTTMIGIVLALSTQFPKRFLFRKRPCMVDRAIQSSKLKTSSFPSRAVTCAVVFAFTLITAYNYQTSVQDEDPEASFGLVGCAAIIFSAFLASSFARIYLGAHYPSDCIFGLLLGSLICLVSWSLFQLPNIFGCPSCYENGCYSSDVTKTMNAANFEPQNLGLTAIVVLVIGVMYVLSNTPPLVFWDKSAPFFGTFSACIVSEIMMVCAKGESKGLNGPNFDNLSASNYIFAVLVAGLHLLISSFASKVHKATRKISLVKSIAINVCIYLIFVVSLVSAIIKVRLT